ncbi:hypothetical protein ACIBJF_41340 [Streptomyces sp. NPDC050743]|uniref:hypothetical protein n=1 Tax=Streptomyces sp. NPDC050743 TaxID=3365634 RepID=UPI00379E47E9
MTDQGPDPLVVAAGLSRRHAPVDEHGRFPEGHVTRDRTRSRTAGDLRSGGGRPHHGPQWADTRRAPSRSHTLIRPVRRSPGGSGAAA